MNKIVTILFLFFIQFSWSQKYAFAFEGEIDTLQILSMEKEIEQFQSVFKVKINYKPRKKKGELIIQLNEEEQNKRGEADSHFSPAEIKAYLISKQLVPSSFLTLEK